MAAGAHHWLLMHQSFCKLGGPFGAENSGAKGPCFEHGIILQCGGTAGPLIVGTSQSNFTYTYWDISRAFDRTLIRKMSREK